VSYPFCVGFPTAVDDKHPFRSEIQILKLQKSAHLVSHFLTIMKDDHTFLTAERYLVDYF
jgi:hypothetical protein